MSKEKILKVWLEGAENARQTAKDMLKLKHYDWSLFFWHLAIEKILKARLFKHNIDVPITHDLVRLVKANKFKIDDGLNKKLNEITTYNVSARYEDEKRSFYKKAVSGL